MKLILAGPGAFGAKHLDALSKIDGADVVSIVGPDRDQASALADTYGVPHTDHLLSDALSRPGVDAAILTTPTQLHAAQAKQCMLAGKHVSVEIPAADNWDDAAALAALSQQTGLVCMVGHTRRYNPSHQWIRQNIEAGEFSIQHLDVQTFFFRRSNLNAKGEPRDWTDHLLWHHAAHTIDLFQYQTGEPIYRANILQGPIHADLGIALDMSIQASTPSGKLLTLTLSFNNEGPLGTVFRYIGDTGTYIANYDDLRTGQGESVDVSSIDVSMNGIELQDRDFVSAIQTSSEPRASIGQVLPCYAVLRDLELQLINQHGASR